LSKRMKRHMSSRFCGSCVVVGTLLSLITMVALHLLRPDYNPLRRFLSEYAVGPFGFLVAAAACELAATFLMLLVGLRLNVHPSGFLTASCVLLGVVVISVGLTAAFPTGVWPPDGGRPTSTWAGIIHVLSAVRIYALLIAVLLTLPSAYNRDENWRPLSHVTLFLGLLILAFHVGSALAPFAWRGLVQRGVGLVILVWLLLTGWRLRKAVPPAHGIAA
jgi:hypothetical protein